MEAIFVFFLHVDSLVSRCIHQALGEFGLWRSALKMRAKYEDKFW